MGKKEGFLFDRSPSYDENSPDGGGASTRSSSSTISSSHNSQHAGYILSIDDIIDMYIVPLIFSPTLYIVVHHNVITFSVSTLLSLLEAVVFPLLLVSIAAERQIEYFPRHDQPDMTSTAMHTKYISTMVLFCCVQRHPLFDDLKSFAGFMEPTPSSLLCSVG